MLGAPIVERRPAPGALVCEQKFRNIEFGSLLEIIELFLSELEDGSAAAPSHPVPAAACLAVAGVVFANSARLTNLDWVVTGSEIAGRLGIGRVEVINDFVAQGFGALTLGDDEVETLHAAPPVPDAPAMSDVAELMTRCWAPEPSERPAFEELAELLKVRGNDGAYSAPPTGARAPARAPTATSAKGRFCTECGEPRTGSKFCGNCGNRH